MNKIKGSNPAKGTLNYELKKILAREHDKNLTVALPRIKEAVKALEKKFKLKEFEVEYHICDIRPGRPYSSESMVIRAYRKRSNRTVAWHKAVLCRRDWATQEDHPTTIYTSVDDPYDRK